MMAVAALALVACADDLGKVGKGPDKTLDTTTIDAVSYDAVYVVNGESATVSVINAETDTVAGTITIKGIAYPHNVAVSPDGSHLGIAVPGFDMSGGESGHAAHASRKGTILLLDARTGALQTSANTDAATNNVVFSGDGSRVLTSQATSPGTTLVLDASTLAVRATIQVGEEPAETLVSSDGALAFVANSGSGTVSVIDVGAQALRTTVEFGAGPVAARPARDGKIYVIDERNLAVGVLDATSLAVLHTMNLGYRAGTVHVDDKGQIWITAPTKGLVELRDESGTVLHSVDTGAGAHDVVFSPDGTRAYVSNELDNSVSVVDRATMTVKTKITVGSAPNGMAWRSK